MRLSARLHASSTWATWASATKAETIFAICGAAVPSSAANDQIRRSRLAHHGSSKKIEREKLLLLPSLALRSSSSETQRKALICWVVHAVPCTRAAMAKDVFKISSYFVAPDASARGGGAVPMACANAVISPERSSLTIISFAKYSEMSTSSANRQKLSSADGAACETASPRPLVPVKSRRRGARALNPLTSALPPGHAMSTTSEECFALMADWAARRTSARTT